MKYKVLYAPEARNDLDEIWEYIAAELANPDAASNTVNTIMDAAEALEDLPERGAPLSSVVGTESCYRFVLAGNYMVFYRIHEAMVYVDRILYQRREYLRVLFDGKL